MERITTPTFVPLRKSLKRNKTGKEDNFMKSYHVGSQHKISLSQQDGESIRLEHSIEIEGDDCPIPLTTFINAGLPQSLNKYLDDKGISNPTSIQMQAISCLLHGRDIIGIAPTGSGKTLAYLLPLCAFISRTYSAENNNAPLALIIVPTRELMQQIFILVSELLDCLEDLHMSKSENTGRSNTNVANFEYQTKLPPVTGSHPPTSTIFTYQHNSYNVIPDHQNMNYQDTKYNPLYPPTSVQHYPHTSSHTSIHTASPYQMPYPPFHEHIATGTTMSSLGIDPSVDKNWQQTMQPSCNQYPFRPANHSKFAQPMPVPHQQTVSGSAKQSYDEYFSPPGTSAVFPQSRKCKALGICGGIPISDQVHKLKQGIDVIVATPGRLLDLCQRQLIQLNKISYLVLDECDKMLDMGLEEQLRKLVGIITLTDIPRQTSLWSATLPESLERLARSAVLNPITIYVGIRNIVCLTIEQSVIFMHTYQKPDKLLETLRQTPFPPVIVFCCTIETVDSVTSLLKEEQFHVAGLHSEKSQECRFKVMSTFKNGRVDVLVTTDLASRGLDIPEVTHVINYDMPNNIEDYIHRCGRTGRFGKSGQATSFLTLECEIAEELKEMLESTGVSVPKALEDPKQFGKKVLKTQFGDRVL